MKATITPNVTDKFNTKHRLDDVKCHFAQYGIVSLAAKPYPDGTISQPITLRLYGTGTRNYAALWAGNEEINNRGTGYAGGYGYHRPSAAAAEAIRNAGIVLDEDIAGVGEDAIRNALMAIARAMKIKRPALIEAHP